MKTKQNLIAAIEKNVIEPYQKPLSAEIQPSIRLKTNGAECPETGRSKLGGCPDFPSNISWPRSEYDHRYLSFLGQVNLRAVKRFDEPDLLPPGGLLYFFFNF